MTPTPESSTSERRFAHLGEMVCSLAVLMDPPDQLSPSEAATRYRKLENQGSYVGPWDNDTTPYMVEPMDETASRVFSGLAFVGPAQSGKTDALCVNTLAFRVKVYPMDMILFCPTKGAARDFSARRVDRLHRHSPEIGKLLMGGKESDNKFDKFYVNGMIFTLSWPSVTEFAGRPIPQVYLTDYDRMDDDIEGDGNPFDLASKRTTSFRSFAMCCAESSPSRPVKDIRWIRKSPHEAPPCDGILSLYNRGDRRRWYWPCPDCGSYFVGDWSHLSYDSDLSDNIDISESVVMVCPHCSHHIPPSARYEMNRRGRWLKDGERIDEDGVITGKPKRGRIASFMLNGVAAAFTSWQNLVAIYLDAQQEFDRTGSEEALKKFHNNDLGEPYIPKSQEAARRPEDLQMRAEDLGGTQLEPVVPDDVRFLVATIDVQLNMFVVQIQGIRPGSPFDMVYVDRFNIHLSDGSIRITDNEGKVRKSLPACAEPRLDGDGQIAWVKPGTYEEDWDLLIERVILRSYPLADGSGRRMQVKMTGCDSGGEAGVTSNAYQFYRKLRRLGYGNRFQLVKGDPKPTASRVHVSYPDSNDRNNKAAAQGDVPVLMLASNILKDTLSNRLDSMVPGRGMHYYPDWLPDWFFTELTVETRTDKGWTKPKKSRNESWDLSYYCIGICLSGAIKIENIDWQNPPSWAKDWDDNSLVSLPESKTERFALPVQRTYDFGKLGRDLA